MKSIFKGKDILVTGGCGSIGSRIVRQLLQHEPKRIRVFDQDEAGHFRLNQELPSPLIRNLIGDVRDKDRVRRALQGVDIVFHAAALKHVPFCEYNPFEAVHTNVIGTQHLVEAAISENVSAFVAISTDKAVNPINTMGATKLLAEKIVTNAPAGFSKCAFCCVRFGNVLDSVGSVIPIFRKQIADGGPVTITSEEMTRFFMSMDDAVALILKSAELAKGGETFILKMKALRIVDLADALIEGLARGYGHDPKRITKTIIGIRPGEKLHEALMTEEESVYMEERDELLILYNSLLAGYGQGIAKRGAHREYASNNVPPLTKTQIAEVLRTQGIL